MLAGVPCITVDQGSMAYPISEHRLENIRDPYIASDEEVTEWLLKLSYSQWTMEEIVNGTAWEHLLEIFVEQGIDILKLADPIRPTDVPELPELTGPHLLETFELTKKQ